nr:type I restriction endonuclease subunit R [Nostoc sp. ChiSLP03a]MDZ8210236.1 type I restriction endonuclease subunit R [Nostoc sp. ChiSLP03a]
MRPPHPDSEEALENTAIELFSQLQWETANCYHEQFGMNNTLGRETRSEVVLTPKLQAALQILNPDLPQQAIQLAIEELKRDRSTLSLANANSEIYQILKNGVKVSFKNDDGEDQTETVKVIDWEEPTNNDFFLASQFWIAGEMHVRRTDLLGFVNGLPLVFFELKAQHKRLDLAYKRNLSDYKQTIPQLFWYNAFIILSNGSHSRISSLTAKWEHFSEWKKINSEGEEGIVSLDTIIRGTCEKFKLLDIVENFIFFYSAKGSLVKIVAKNHQYLGSNQAVKAVKQIRLNQGKLGVFWHTQGSGKSYSMVFFSQKVLRKLHGNWTFVIVTDREDLDNQIYKNFAYAGAVTEPETQVRARSGEHLKELLSADHRYIFTMIQKFRTEKGGTYPQLSNRPDIIVIADEAHRSQYDTFALNLRSALPHAAFIGFTGTPLMAGEEETKQTFGDYISIYNFRQSIDDWATVPLYYENRVPELQLNNDGLNENMASIIDTAMLDEEQERLLERECAREYQLITRDDRLETIAQDIVTHFMGRGYQGKAMVVSIDRFTAVRMYNKVQHHWQQYIANLKTQRAHPQLSEFERKKLSNTIKYMEETDMAVIVSQSQNEIEDFQKKGLDITPHRKRVVSESPGLDEKFKDSSHPLRITFVCAMWMTGFDIPNCSTIYLDKPMKNHTLMQTIARANRVFPGKEAGVIVDYFGVFKNLKQALAIYGSASGGGVREGDIPVKPKAALVAKLKEAIAETTAFCTQREINFSLLESATGFTRVKFWKDAVEAILINEESKKTFLSLAANVKQLYKAVLPDTAANEFTAICSYFERIKEQIFAEGAEVDISDVMPEVEKLLDDSIFAGEFVIQESQSQQIDLSKLDFAALKARFASSEYQHTETEKLKAAVNNKVQEMVKLNKTRMNYLEKFQKMIAEYNADSLNVVIFFNDLVNFAQELDVEQKRAIAQNLTEEELAIFDLLTKPEISLTKQEEEEVKQVAKELLVTLKREKLVLDWRKRQQSKASVEVAIKDILDRLPANYSIELYELKCQEIYQHIYENYSGQGSISNTIYL